MKIAILSSHGRCGIYEYSQVLAEGFRQAGHEVRYLGVPNWDDQALFAAARQVRDEELVIVEYEPGIFRLRALVLAMAYLRFRRRKEVMLSIHEIEPAKYPEYHLFQGRLSQPVRFGGIGEIGRIAWFTADVALRYAYLRLFLFFLGAVPQRVLVHSPKGLEQVGIAANPQAPKIFSVPLHIKSQEGDRRRLRQELGLPEAQFLFIIPGFLFRRKRIVEVISQVPEGTSLLIVGTPSEFDPGYLEEIERALANHPEKDIRLIQDYDRMEQYLLASDAAILFYQDIYQSAVAGLVLGAGKPAIFSDLPAFQLYREGGILVRATEELGPAMRELQQPETYRRLREGALALRERLSPVNVARMYLAPLGRVEEGA